MRILFVTDIHGSEVCFRKFLNSRQAFEPDVMIVGGDITGKVLIPVVAVSNGAHVAHTTHGARKLTTPGELAEFEKECAEKGSYVWRCSEDEFDGATEETFERACRDEILVRVRRWMRLAEERLSGCRTPVFVSGGNDDFWEVDEVLHAANRVECPDRAVVELPDGVEMLSFGGANQTPWDCPRDMPEEALGEVIDGLATRLSGRPAIFNLHVPPFDTRLDAGPKLDDHNRPSLGVEGLERVPVGSRAVRERTMRYQPILGIHGHVHESCGSDRLGDAVVLNPGSEYAQGLLRGALIEIRRGRVKRHQFICG